MSDTYIIIVESSHEVGSDFPSGMIRERFGTYEITTEILSQFLEGFVDVDVVLT